MSELLHIILDLIISSISFVFKFFNISNDDYHKFWTL